MGNKIRYIAVFSFYALVVAAIMLLTTGGFFEVSTFLNEIFNSVLIAIPVYLGLFVVYDVLAYSNSWIAQLLKVVAILESFAFFAFEAFLSIMRLLTINDNDNVLLYPLEALWGVAIIVAYLMYKNASGDGRARSISLFVLPSSMIVGYIVTLPFCFIFGALF
ncbi:MAG: hypothetical protein IJY18_05805 [Clostridia bacterium]|nr:hypothetical protein [Clostridia bacterium]